MALAGANDTSGEETIESSPHRGLLRANFMKKPKAT
jgi:hypothetical protein